MQETGPPCAEITYHNEAYVSDVEVELDLEYTPTPVRVGGLKKCKSRNTKDTNCYKNRAFDGDKGSSGFTKL